MGKVAFENAKITSTSLPNLDILESGKFTLSAFELLRGDMLKNLLDKIRPQYDTIIIDTPPMNMVTDAYMICPLIDFALVVLHYGRHSMDSIKESIQTLERYCDKPKAFVLNHSEHRHGYYGYYGYYGYGYGYAHKSKND